MIELKGKTAVITGGARGIGKAIALKFAQKGMNIAIPYVDSVSPTEALAEFTALGVKAKAYLCDVSNFDATKATCDEIVKDFGGVDVLVNNAGITKDNLILRMGEKDWDAVLSVNLKGAFNMIKHLTSTFMKTRDGAIINISSVSGMMGNAGQANYAASKAGLIGLTKSVARELSSRNITCNAVAPGFIETVMTAALNDQQQAALKNIIPLGCYGKPDDVASAVLFLAENRYITGEVIKVDGGMYI